MADIKFSCPQCEQHIAADSGYGGMQINCPACNLALIVPSADPQAIAQTSLVPVTVQESVSSAPAAGAPRLRTQAQAPVDTSAGCPSCGSALPDGAVLCISCGYNLSTRKRMVTGQAAAPARPSAAQWETPWYKTALPYVAVIFAVIGLGYYFGRDNPKIVLGLVGVAALYCLCVQIMVIVAGFKYGAGTGFLTLCLPFYALYFVYKVHDNETLKVLYGGAILINIGLRFLAK